MIIDRILYSVLIESKVVSVPVPAIKGKANKAVIEVLSDYFKVKKAAIRIIKGEASREKLIRVVGF